MFSRDVKAAMLMSLNKGVAALLVSPTKPPRIKLYSYVSDFFCFGWKILIDHVSEKTQSELVERESKNFYKRRKNVYTIMS